MIIPELKHQTSLPGYKVYEIFKNGSQIGILETTSREEVIELLNKAKKEGRTLKAGRTMLFNII